MSFWYDETLAQEFFHAIMHVDESQYHVVSLLPTKEKKEEYTPALFPTLCYRDEAPGKSITLGDAVSDVTNRLVGNVPEDERQDTLDKYALYCSTTPRNIMRACAELGADYAKMVGNHALGNKPITPHDFIQNMNLRLQNASAKPPYVGIDVVDKPFYWPLVDGFLESENIEPVCVIETRGGYHVIIPAEDEDFRSRMWQFIQNDPSKRLRVLRNNPSPIPGSKQYGYHVSLFYKGSAYHKALSPA